LSESETLFGEEHVRRYRETGGEISLAARPTPERSV
jgi:hypothetical protein